MSKSQHQYRPPRLAQRILHWLCKDELLEEIEGDLEEYYLKERETTPAWRANLSYWFHALHFLRPFALKRKRQNSNILIMYNSYFKFAWRNILKHKGSTGLNVLSLSVGIACFIFVFIYIKGELSYDKFHKDYQDIYRVAIDLVDSNGNRLPDATTPPALAPVLKEAFPEVAQSVRLFPSWGTKFLIGTDESNRFYEEGVLRTDSTFFDVFTFKPLFGNLESALNAKDNIVVTESMAKKYFGRTDVLGETLTLYSGINAKFKVAAVIEDVPKNSHFKFDFLSRISFSNIDNNWGWFNYYTYIRLRPGAQVASLEPKLQPFYESSIDEEEYYNIIYTQPLTDIHLKSDLKWELEANGNIDNIYIFAALGFFILVISCLNYLNLTVSGTLKRFKEVGVRKVFGAHKTSLVSQFIIETVLVVFLSIVLGSFLAELLFRNLQDIIGTEVSLFQPENILILLAITGIVMVFGILAGLYPALHLSSFKVANAVRGVFNKSGKSILGLRKVLLVIQFSISVFMIFGTLGVYKQLKYVQSVDKGLSPEQVIVIENASSVANQELLKTELEKIPNVQSAAISSGVIGKLNWTTSVGYPDEFLLNFINMEPDYVETMGLEIIAGRNFEKDRPTDSEGNTIIMNETGFKELGLSFEDIGKSVPLEVVNDTTIVRGEIIGVVKDFNFAGYKSSVKPFAFFYRKGSMNYLNVKIGTTNVSETLRSIEDTWSEVGNGSSLEYFFLEQTYADLYAQETRLSTLMKYLTGLAVFIAVIGMFAITNMNLRDRRKEIAIRKVLGGSVTKVSGLIISKFLILVLIANAIAIPMAYYFVQGWLNDFAYRTSLGLLVFIVAFGATMLIAWVTVGVQSWVAASSNPVNNLRSE